MREPLTEARNPKARGLGTRTTREILELMNDEDATVAGTVRGALDAIERAVETIVDALRSGGRLRYVGAGTSGRLGVLDASEIPPTFGAEAEAVRGIIAGGDAALRSAAEGAEDDGEAGARDVGAEVRRGDVVVGISAGGRAPYVRSALRAAREVGARTIALTCDAGAPIATEAEWAIVVPVGPEIVAGSTRLKAGTATKLVLNMLTTAGMVRLGRTRDDLMADLRPGSVKLRARAVAIVRDEAGVSELEAERRLEAAGWDVRRALAR